MTDDPSGSCSKDVHYASPCCWASAEWHAEHDSADFVDVPAVVGVDRRAPTAGQDRERIRSSPEIHLGRAPRSAGPSAAVYSHARDPTFLPSPPWMCPLPPRHSAVANLRRLVGSHRRWGS